jgi:hypothetical protein
MMAQVIIHETRQPTDEVLQRHRRVFEDSGVRVLEEPQVELVPNPDYLEGSDAPREFYRLTFQVEAPSEEVPGVEALSDDELAALVRLVQALVDHDEVVLRDAGAYDHGDPYEFTRRWRLWDHVDVIMPPGEPRTWQMDVYRHGRDVRASIVCDMFTVQEGRSDLTLEVDLVAGEDGAPLVRFGNLHVM